MFHVNGKIRSKAELAAGTPKDVLEKTAMEDSRIKEFISGKEIVRIISVPDKLVNIVVK